MNPGYGIDAPLALELLAEVLCLIALSYASYLDVKFREVEPAYWYAWLRILAPLGFAEAYTLYKTGFSALTPRQFTLYVAVSNTAAIGVAYGAYAAGLLGGGDVLAVALVSLADPIITRSILVPSLLSLLYGSLAALLVTLYFCTLNLSRNRGLLQELARRKGAFTALKACFTSYPARVGEALSKGWLYPATWEVGEYNLVEADPPEILSQLAEERGFEETVWVTLGLPQVLFIAIGFTLSLIIGDKPLQALLTLIKG
jgi:prepilin signal peptidase PulO-like enzyme (type II secretory pathway)